jgi:hypothetical protein
MSVRKKSMWGGPRKGAGRPPGTGPGPSPHSRRNRVVIMLSDAELVKLRKLARQQDLPLGTVAYEIVARSLKRRK